MLCIELALQLTPLAHRCEIRISERNLTPVQCTCHISCYRLTPDNLWHTGRQSIWESTLFSGLIAIVIIILLAASTLSLLSPQYPPRASLTTCQTKLQRSLKPWHSLKRFAQVEAFA